jgi:hypothetical protein
MGQEVESALNSDISKVGPYFCTWLSVMESGLLHTMPIHKRPLRCTMFLRRNMATYRPEWRVGTYLSRRQDKRSSTAHGQCQEWGLEAITYLDKDRTVAKIFGRGLEPRDQ